MTPRRATEAELAPLAALFERRWYDAHGAVSPPALIAMRTPADFAARLRAYFDAGDLWVAGKGSAPVGFVAVKGRHIDQLYVAAAQTGSGLAARLMAHAEAALKERGHSVAEVWCHTENPRAARFYRKSGWRHRATEDVALDSATGTFQLRCFVFEKPLI